MSGRGGQEGGYLEDVGGFLTRDLEDRVILDTMDYLGGPQGPYPEGFMSFSIILAEIYMCVTLVKKKLNRQTVCFMDFLLFPFGMKFTFCQK